MPRTLLHRCSQIAYVLQPRKEQFVNYCRKVIILIFYRRTKMAAAERFVLSHMSDANEAEEQRKITISKFEIHISKLSGPRNLMFQMPDHYS